MNIECFREGNLIKVYPEGHQEGLLAIKEILGSSFICEMISPRPGYLFRTKHSEMNPIPLTEDWLLYAGYMKEEGDGTWTDDLGTVSFLWSDNKGTFQNHDSQPVGYVHEFQNEYERLTGEKIFFAV